MFCRTQFWISNAVSTRLKIIISGSSACCGPTNDVKGRAKEFVGKWYSIQNECDCEEKYFARRHESLGRGSARQVNTEKSNWAFKT